MFWGEPGYDQRNVADGHEQVRTGHVDNEIVGGCSHSLVLVSINHSKNQRVPEHRHKHDDAVYSDYENISSVDHRSRIVQIM